MTVALGRLAAERDQLRRKLEEQEPEAVRQFHQTVFLDTVRGDRYSRWKCSPQEIDQRYKMAGKIIKRIVEIERRLAQIQKEGATIKKHCTASPEEIRAEAEKHKKYLSDLDTVELGLRFIDGGSAKTRAKRMMKERGSLPG